MSSYKIAKTLIRKGGARVNAKTKTNQTPLMMAANCGSVELVELLLKKRANISILNIEGSSALDISVCNFQLDIVVLLLLRGAKLRFKSSTVSYSNNFH